MSKMIMIFIVMLANSCSVNENRSFNNRNIASTSKQINKLNFEDIEYLKLLSHNNVPKKILIYSDSDYKNKDVIKSFFEIIDEINRNLSNDEKIKIIIAGPKISEQTVNELGVRGDSAIRNLDDIITLESNVFLQDFGEIMLVKAKQDSKAKLLLLDSNHSEALSEFAASLSLKFNSYYLKNPRNNVTDGGDFGGNIEVTPNNVSYIGSTSSVELRTLLNKLSVKPQILNSNWLSVGHVDEYISTIITNDKCGFAILKADPLAALAAIKISIDDDLKKLKDKYYSDDYKFSAIKSYKDILNNEKYIDPRMKDQFRNQYLANDVINKNIEILKKKIKEVSSNCDDIKVVSIPVLFNCATKAIGGVVDDFNKAHCVSLLPDSVNMIVLREHLIVPDSFFEPFNKAIYKRLSELNQKVHFVNDFKLYHDKQGDIHCGVNVLREPNRFINNKIR